LAEHDWVVVGVDFSAVAIRRARRRARRAGSSCQFYRADVTKVAFLVQPFDLALDIGCLHSVPTDRWEAYVSEVARLVRPGGLYMLYAFVPGHRSGLGGIAPAEVQRLFEASFALVRQKGGDDASGPRSAWYWMCRRQ
jgi:SAM-dependent methyltransferase